VVAFEVCIPIFNILPAAVKRLPVQILNILPVAIIGLSIQILNTLPAAIKGLSIQILNTLPAAVKGLSIQILNSILGIVRIIQLDKTVLPFQIHVPATSHIINKCCGAGPFFLRLRLQLVKNSGSGSSKKIAAPPAPQQCYKLNTFTGTSVAAQIRNRTVPAPEIKKNIYWQNTGNDLFTSGLQRIIQFDKITI
jgi:hypothetical protein